MESGWVCNTAMSKASLTTYLKQLYVLNIQILGVLFQGILLSI